MGDWAEHLGDIDGKSRRGGRGNQASPRKGTH
jgi:hypothetical protein